MAAERPRVLLVVDAVESVNRRLAIGCIARHGLLPAFADSAGEALSLIASGQVDAVAVLPPLGHGDAFALLAAARARCPNIDGAIVMGDGPDEVLGARVLWVSSAPTAPDVVEAVAALAQIRLPLVSPISWDEPTSEINEVVLEMVAD